MPALLGEVRVTKGILVAGVRSKQKSEVGGYFDQELVSNVRDAAAWLGMTLTEFVAWAYRDGLDRDDGIAPTIPPPKREGGRRGKSA